MHARNLNELFTHEIRDLVSAEDQILASLPDLVENATDPELKSALRKHLDETKRHRSRLQNVAKDLNIELDGLTCKGMAGILREGSDLIGKQNDETVRDAAIIASAQRVEHYEMAGYGTAAHFARSLGHDEAAHQLDETLDEEKQADASLSRIADNHVNARALRQTH